jgi:Uma2 family endonuclease
MDEVKILTPPRTIMEVFKMLPEGTLVELLNGTLYMSPAPTKSHQRLIKALALSISAVVEPNGMGELFLAPYDVFLDEEENVVQPDLFFISQAKSSIAIENGVHGVPDLIIEILSPGNFRHDSVTKKDLYEKFGVQEYWIVNPATKEALGYTLKEGVYSEIGLYTCKINSLLLKSDFIF